jgi:hypothetical protein
MSFGVIWTQRLRCKCRCFYWQKYTIQRVPQYIRLGKWIICDKVETYDKLKDVIQGKSLPDGLSDIQRRKDIEHHMLQFWITMTSNVWPVQFVGTPEKENLWWLFPQRLVQRPQWFILVRNWEAGNEKMDSERILELLFWLCWCQVIAGWITVNSTEVNLRIAKSHLDFYKRLLISLLAVQH